MPSSHLENNHLHFLCSLLYFLENSLRNSPTLNRYALGKGVYIFSWKQLILQAGFQGKIKTKKKMHFDKVDWLIKFHNHLYACWFLLRATIAKKLGHFTLISILLGMPVLMKLIGAKMVKLNSLLSPYLKSPILYIMQKTKILLLLSYLTYFILHCSKPSQFS